MSITLQRLLLASNNLGKLRELRAALAPLGIEVITLDEPFDVEETGTTFDANATLKAVAFAEHAGMPALADDSGIAVAALDGAPGVYSARFAGTPGDSASNNAHLLERLDALDDPNRDAYFHCSLALAWPSSQSVAITGPLPSDARTLDAPQAGFIVDGRTHGVILGAERGEGGFGYDPLFLSNDLDKTFAEASAEEKSAVSHRGRAVQKLLAVLEALAET